LAAAASVSDVIVVESFLVSSVLNAIPATAGSVGSTYLASNLTLTTPTLTTPTLNSPIIGSWTTATRPSSPVAGMTGYNTSYGGVEVYNGSAWDTITGGPTFLAYNNTAQTITNVTNTLIAYQVKGFDTAGCFNNTNGTVTLNGLSVPAYSFCPNIAGYYQVTGSFQANLGASGRAIETFIAKNGGNISFGSFGVSDPNNYASSVATSVVYLNGTGDYVNVYVWQGTGGSATSSYGEAQCNFSAAMVRSV
jgi:hypothetical protein